MPRIPLKASDIAPRIIVLSLWIGPTCGFLYDSTVPIIKGTNQDRAWIIISVYIFFSILFLWSYVIACWGDPGSIEAYYKEIGVLDQLLADKFPNELTVIPRCEKCHLPKPERTHHCSKCGLCYFRFDHHCPIIGNCVAMKNYKAFILMPIYISILLIIFGVEMTFQHSIFFCIPFIALTIPFLYFSLSYCPLIFNNLTTLEKETIQYVPDYRKDHWSNFQEMFPGFFSVFLPMPPKISGFYWAGENICNGVIALERRSMPQKHHDKRVFNKSDANEIDDKANILLNDIDDDNENENTKNAEKMDLESTNCSNDIPQNHNVP